MFPSHSSVRGCHRGRCLLGGQGSVSHRQTGRPPVSSCQLLSPPGQLKTISGKAFCPTCAAWVGNVSCHNKAGQTVFFMLTECSLQMIINWLWWIVAWQRQPWQGSHNFPLEIQTGRNIQIEIQSVTILAVLANSVYLSCPVLSTAYLESDRWNISG